MKIIIAGLGAVGEAIMQELSAAEHNIVVIDKDDQKIENAINTYDVNGVIGNAASSAVLNEAGVATADLFIAATADDELNILCCIIANKLGIKKTIARASKPEYQELFQAEGDLGLSLMVNPQYEAAMEISRMLRFPSAIKVNSFSGGLAELVEFRVPQGSPLIGISLKDLGKTYPAKVLIVAARRNDKPVIPTGDFVIAAEDRLFLTATSKSIYQFFKQLGWNKAARNVMIVGGSTTAYYLCQQLEKLKINAKLIEKSKERCLRLSEQLNKTTVICGDGTDQEMMTEEGIDSTDAFVALGNIDEQNIIMSMYAASKDVPKVITKIDQLAYYDMLQKSGIYSAVSTKTSTAEQIIRFVRLLESKESTVKRVFHIIDGTTEIIEFVATERFRACNVPLREMNLKRHLLVAAIIREGILITPSGQDVIMPGDNVIIVTLHEELSSLNDILNI